MNRSKLIGSTALATLMTAGAASAEMSIGGYISGYVNDGPGETSQALSTNSVIVSYSDSLDNGMGIGVVMSISQSGGNTAGISIDTGMGTVKFGESADSAVDGFDSNPGCFSMRICYSVAISGKGGGTNLYDDGDASSGNSIKYSNSMGGVSFAVSRGMGSATYEPTMSYAASTSIMGASIAAGVSQIDRKGTGVDQDPSFVTVGYSIAGLNLGYAVYDSDTNGEETSMGVGTSVMGMDVGVQFASYDTSEASTTDTDYMRVSVNKGMGAASFGIDYLETDVAGGSSDDTDTWHLNYVIGF